MKHIIISYIFYVLLLGSSFCLGRPQQYNESNRSMYTRDETIMKETTTAEPKKELLSRTILNNILISQTPVMTTKKVEINDTTTALYHENVTTKSIYYSQSEKSTTPNLHHTILTTTAIPITVSSSTISSAQRQFDILSFMGGCLFTFCLIAIGIVLWKAYKMQIERNYRTI